jgi:hypothetical protein
MRIRTWTPYLILAMALALPSVGQATITKNNVGGTERVQCRGEDVQVNGSSAELILLGECPDVQVNGMSNTVKIELAKNIQVNGMSNKVIWEQSLVGAKPRIQTSGVGNSVRQGTVTGHAARVESGGGDHAAVIESDSGSVTLGTKRGKGTITAESSDAGTVVLEGGRHGESGKITAQTEGESVTLSEGSIVGRTTGRSGGAKIVISDNRLTKTIECAGRDVSIDGNLNALSFLGECGSVEVSGNGNVVRIEAAAAIETLGNRNTVTWERGLAGKNPAVSNLGTGNSISRMSE